MGAIAVRQRLPRCSVPILLAGSIFLRVRRRARRGWQLLGFGRPEKLALADLAPPDSALAKSATELALDVYDEHFLGHGLRTHARAVAVGHHLSLDPDPEALYVACLLHDVGLMPRFDGPLPFELRGANAAHAVCLPDESRATVVHEAIAVHTSLRAALGPAVVRLVQSGSGGDLIGLDSEFVHSQTLAAIEARWRRGDAYAEHVGATLKKEAGRHPRSPAAGLVKIGFAREIRLHDRSYGPDP